MLVPTSTGLWIATALVWAISAWTILAAIIEIVRGKSRPWSADVIVAVLFHGGTAVLSVRLAHMAGAANG